MKKLLALVATVVLLISSAATSVFAADDLVIDMSKVVAKEGFSAGAPVGLWPAAGYTDKYVASFCNFGAYASIGNVDLSKYKEVVVSYARSQNVNYDSYKTKFAITKNGPIQKGSDAVDNATAGVVAEYKFVGALEGGWQGIAEETIAINSDYSGELFIANYLDPAFTHGFVVTDIKFVAKTSSGNPSTFDMGLTSIAVMSVASLAVAKKRK